MADEHDIDDWTKNKLMDIDRDTDSILKKIGDIKMTDSNFDSGALMGMLANKGIDPGLIALMKDRTAGGWGADGGIWLILLFLFLLGGNGFNRGGPAGDPAGVDRTIFNQSNYDNLMTAISTNGTRQDAAISQLAQNLNVDNTAISNALASVDKEIAINRGDIKSAIQSCCCNIRTEMQSLNAASNLQAAQNHDATMSAIQDAKYHITERTAATNALVQDKFAEQTLQIQQAFANQNSYLAEQFCAIRNREDARTIQDLRDKLNEQRQQANTLAIVQAIQNQRLSASGVMDTTAGTWSGNVLGQ